MRPPEQPQFGGYAAAASALGGVPMNPTILQVPHHPSLSATIVGVNPNPNPNNATPYSIYEAASQPNPPPSSSGMTIMNEKET